MTNTECTICYKSFKNNKAFCNKCSNYYACNKCYIKLFEKYNGNISCPLCRTKYYWVHITKDVYISIVNELIYNKLIKDKKATKMISNFYESSDEEQEEGTFYLDENDNLIEDLEDLEVN